MDHMTVSVFVAGKIILVVHKTVYYFLHNSPARTFLVRTKVNCCLALPISDIFCIF